MGNSISSDKFGLQSSQRGINGQKQNIQAITKTQSSTEAGPGAAETSTGMNKTTDLPVNRKLKKLQADMPAEEVKTSSYMIGEFINIKV